MSIRSFNRREALRIGAFGGASALLSIGAAGRRVFAGEFLLSPKPAAGAVIRLSGNENPYGPSPKAKQAIIEALSLGNRYAQTEAAQLEKMIAERESVAPESVVPGSGSGEVLAMAAVAYGLD
jgi:histidinol-phosphate aminotransferase